MCIWTKKPLFTTTTGFYILTCMSHCPGFRFNDPVVFALNQHDKPENRVKSMQSPHSFGIRFHDHQNVIDKATGDIYEYREAYHSINLIGSCGMINKKVSDDPSPSKKGHEASTNVSLKALSHQETLKAGFHSKNNSKKGLKLRTTSNPASQQHNLSRKESQPKAAESIHLASENARKCFLNIFGANKTWLFKSIGASFQFFDKNHWQVPVFSKGNPKNSINLEVVGTSSAGVEIFQMERLVSTRFTLDKRIQETLLLLTNFVDHFLEEPKEEKSLSVLKVDWSNKKDQKRPKTPLQLSLSKVEPEKWKFGEMDQIDEMSFGLRNGNPNRKNGMENLMTSRSKEMAKNQNFTIMFHKPIKIPGNWENGEKSYGKMRTQDAIHSIQAKMNYISKQETSENGYREPPEEALWKEEEEIISKSKANFRSLRLSHQKKNLSKLSESHGAFHGDQSNIYRETSLNQLLC